MSIFDGIINDMSSFGDALAQGVGLLGKSSDSQGTSDASEYKTLRLMNLLESGKMQLPYTQGKEFTASKSKPAEQADPDAINQRWLQRLNRYSSIPQVQGAK